MHSEKCIFLSRSAMQLVVLDNRKITYPLELRDFNLLQCLLTSEDFVATRKELLTAGWPGRIVSETSLNVAIMKLRKRTEKCSDILQIKTISGHGYRLKLAEGLRFVESKEEISQCLHELENNEDVEDLSIKVESKEIKTTTKVKRGKLSVEERPTIDHKIVLSAVIGMIVVGLLLYIAMK